MKVLIVDDEEDIRDILEYNLKKEGYEVALAENGKECLGVAKKFKPDLILMDVMMPEMDGIEACEELRSDKLFDQTVICFLTARSEDYSQIAGLESGADDYISKPVKPKVLMSKIKSLLRRGTGHGHVNVNEEHSSEFSIDQSKYLVINKGVEILLPKKEFELLTLLYSEVARVFTREEILDNVWGKDIVVGDRTIDVHIRKLREKIGSERIVTIKGVGYKLML
jgi:two-component system alkaline phosphatase synthesis response regulator PhoP